MLLIIILIIISFMTNTTTIPIATITFKFKKISLSTPLSAQPPPSSRPQHANADVEKIILGNKCDMEDRRQVPKEKGEEVGGRLLRGEAKGGLTFIHFCLIFITPFPIHPFVTYSFIHPSTHSFIHSSIHLSTMKIALQHRIPFLETSAKNDINVERAFFQLAQVILEKVVWMFVYLHVCTLFCAFVCVFFLLCRGICMRVCLSVCACLFLLLLCA